MLSLFVLLQSKLRRDYNQSPIAYKPSTHLFYPSSLKQTTHALQSAIIKHISKQINKTYKLVKVSFVCCRRIVSLSANIIDKERH